jgi:hypothetical protein
MLTLRPKLKISLFPLTRPTLSKLADWNFFIGNLQSLFFSFRSKFVLLKIPYFRFVSPKDRNFRITEHIFVVKKRKSLPTYLPTSKIVSWVRGNRNIFNCGLGFRRKQLIHVYVDKVQLYGFDLWCLMPLSAMHFFCISVISWRSVLLVEETGVPRENHRPMASHWQALSHNVVSSTPHLSGIHTHNVSGARHWLHM